MRFSIREICKTLFLCIASLNLGLSGGPFILGVVFAVAFVYLHFRYAGAAGGTNAAKRPRYKKSIAYAAIVPCAIWWVLTPGVDYGFSPFVVFIPAWYLLFLAWLQKRSVGNGAYEVFVVFNGVAVLIMGMFQTTKPCVLFGTFGLLLAVHAYSRTRTALYKHLLLILLFVFFCATSFAGWKFWKSHHHYNGHWAEDYYARTRVMGFDPVAALGSFSSNYNSKYNSQVVLRIWDSLAPEYLRAAVYEKYVAGIWKLPEQPAKKLYPNYFWVDYAVFEVADSATQTDDVKQVWVQAALDNFGFMFAAPNALGVAAKNADSLDYYATNVFTGLNVKRSDWYYFVKKSAENQNAYLSNDATAEDSLHVARALQITEFYRRFVDSVANEMNLADIRRTFDSLVVAGVLQASDSSQIAYATLDFIKKYFNSNFEYTLKIPGLDRHWKKTIGDPLFQFWKTKKGYCEYYATLSTLLLRHQGIPARYVTGFAHPQRVEGRPYALFRRNHSHAWVEVLVGNRWISYDPTPPIPVTAFAESSWFQEKWEGVRGRFAHLFHLLKEGEWRRTVDSWQQVTEAILGSVFFYVALGLCVVVIVLLKFRSRKRVHVLQKDSLKAKLWIARLDRAEKKLRRYGYERHPGETVAAFFGRTQLLVAKNPLKESRRKACLDALCELEEYEKSRWRL